MVFVFSAGNDGPNLQTVDPPGTAKNVICVGATENVQPIGGEDGCGTSDAQADNFNDIVDFSSRGPCADGRKKPDLVAPGTHVSGGVAQAASPAATGTALACYDGSGVCGGVSIPPAGGDVVFPPGQQWYTLSSGTSHSCPAVAGACALLRQYFLNAGRAAPSPAMTKAFLVNTARYLTGLDANDTLWSNHQGWGFANLDDLLTNTVQLVVRDQVASDRFTATGQVRSFYGRVPDPTKPFKVTLAWTDAPGNTTGAAWNNDLDLWVTVQGAGYPGNSFRGKWSVSSDETDYANNVECVFLPAGTVGTYRIDVVAANIVSDGVPNNANALDQDFALIATNALESAQAVLETQGTTGTSDLVSESCIPANGAIDPNEVVGMRIAVKNVGTVATGNLAYIPALSANLLPVSGVTQLGVLNPGETKDMIFYFQALGQPGGEFDGYVNITSNNDAWGRVGGRISLCAVGAPMSYSFVGPPVPIPDANPVGVDVPIVVAGVPEKIGKVILRIDRPKLFHLSGCHGSGS